jgi:restriction system protein
MPEVTRKRTGQFLQELFRLLLENNRSMPAKEALAKLEQRSKLTPYEAGNYETGGRRFEKIVRFATVDCVKAGWLLKDKGTWTITDDGAAALARWSDPEYFYKEAVKLYQAWKRAQPGDETMPVEPDPTPTPESKSASITYEEAEEHAWDEIRAYVGSMPPYEFQDLVAALLRTLDYHVTWIAPPGKDGGVDILAWSDPLGVKPPRVKVQVKRQQTSVSVEGLRSFLAVLGEEDVGIFVCTGGFTKDARDEARTQEKRKISLIDLERFVVMWTTNYARLSDEAKRKLPLRPIWFLAPQE